ncbi:tetratricopeptide repeat protein [Paracoccus denitrificans]|uniref:tetratricopeptide repeat protein n=1 Tax=Paracoccus denitrificans TaxID=266 RepID=UPI00336529C0
MDLPGKPKPNQKKAGNGALKQEKGKLGNGVGKLRGGLDAGPAVTKPAEVAVPVVPIAAKLAVPAAARDAALKSAELAKPHAARVTPAALVRPAAEIIQRFERSGKSLPDIPAIDPTAEYDLISLARAFAHYNGVGRALRCLDYIPAELMDVECIRFLASLYAKIAQYDTALAQLNRIQMLDLSAQAARKVQTERMQYLRMSGDYDSALALGARLVEEFPRSIETCLAYVVVLGCAGRHEEAERRFLELLERSEYKQGVVERYCDHLYENNRLHTMLAILSVAEGKFGRQIAISWRRARHFWLVGHSEGFNAACDDVVEMLDAGQRLQLPGIKFFSALQDADDWQGVGRVQAAMGRYIDQVCVEMKGVPIGRLDFYQGILNDALTLGHMRAVSLIGQALTEAWPFLARGWYAMGVLALEQNRFEKAEKYLRKAQELDPTHLEHYSALFNLVASHPGRLEELEELIETRNHLVPVFSDKYPDGRNRYFDVDIVLMNYIRGDYRAAYQLRSNPRTVRYVEAVYGKKYQPLAVPAFTETRKGKLTIIAQDGVGDEIRWARYYEGLREYYSEVCISCDPRLEHIFTRSFPDYRFVPVARRWHQIPWRPREHREEIADIAMAGKLSGALHHEIVTSERILFIEEVGQHKWARDGIANPVPAPKGPYLKADSDLAEYWAKRLEEDAGGRLKVGLLWRSGLSRGKRAAHYMAVNDLLPLTRNDCCFVSLQADMTPDEMIACAHQGIRTYDEVDLYNDFDNVAALTANLDLVIGISTLPLEMAAAVGTECWVLVFSAFGKHIRMMPDSGENDVLSANSVVISGDENGRFALPHGILVRNAVRRATARLRERMKERRTL